ncbi:hypothetical protein PoB_000752300 [Plakobranchus ocellatus]|uniref:Uncharacterized protein n=1 Tax=Plakobranchus ocellatus TaxID=259542 RepID=A0AAV3YEV9_9GAST|nr:hypothetical protein PoB_000752300 [Plakobranchus ocellatus]
MYLNYKTVWITSRFQIARTMMEDHRPGSPFKTRQIFQAESRERICNIMPWLCAKPANPPSVRRVCDKATDEVLKPKSRHCAGSPTMKDESCLR